LAPESLEQALDAFVRQHIDARNYVNSERRLNRIQYPQDRDQDEAEEQDDKDRIAEKKEGMVSGGNQRFGRRTDVPNPSI